MWNARCNSTPQCQDKLSRQSVLEVLRKQHLSPHVMKAAVVLAITCVLIELSAQQNVTTEYPSMYPYGRTIALIVLWHGTVKCPEHQSCKSISKQGDNNNKCPLVHLMTKYQLHDLYKRHCNMLGWFYPQIMMMYKSQPWLILKHYLRIRLEWSGKLSGRYPIQSNPSKSSGNYTYHLF